MKKYYTVPICILSIVSITFLCTSYVPSLTLMDRSGLEEGAYVLSTLGELSLNLSGSASLNTEETISGDGNLYTTLNLKLENDGEIDRHFVDIYIADPEITQPFAKRTYEISENIDGFINDFQGVFGIADIDRFGELPFFTKGGQISVFHADHHRMAGNLKLTLMNTIGQTIELEGDFIAAFGR